MDVREATTADHAELLEIWLRSVRATHDFLTEENIQQLYPLVRDHALPQLELWVLTSDEGQAMGFMGLSDHKLEAIFLAPEFLRQGGGRRLVDHARALKGPLDVDVNEQNPQALKFYEALGFVVVGRSERDGFGHPYPLLHLRQER